MSTQCNASVTWFREPGHVRMDDKCILENGHMDYDHLPAGKAAEQMENRVWNQAVDAAVAAAQGAEGAASDDPMPSIVDAINGLRR